MNEDRDQDRGSKPRAPRKRQPGWEQDLRPRRRTGAQIAQPTDAQVEAEWTAFHQRKRGQDSSAVNEERAVGGSTAATPAATSES
jgi:hypothetical protein